MTILLSFVFRSLQHRLAMHYLYFALEFCRFDWDGGLHLWRRRDSWICRDIMCYVYLNIHWIFEGGLRYLICGSIFLDAKNHQREFILVFRFTNRFENYFVGSFIAFGRTMHDLFNRPIDHRRYVELNGPINLLMIIYWVDYHSLLIEYLGILYLGLLN
jgi:hypothetical protein